MGNKKLLSLADLYNYFSAQSKNVRFSSKDDNQEIIVQIDGKLNYSDENVDADKESLFPVTLQACHTGVNKNNSKIEKTVMEKALASFSNRPILGYIHTVEGVDEFYTHNMHMEDDEIVYDEVPIGIIPESCNAHLEYDEDKDKEYVVVNGYIFEGYSKAKEILKREKECSVSVELNIRDMSFNAQEKVLNIEDFYFTGVTILGKTPSGAEVLPGMDGANIKIGDFSKAENSLFENIDNTKLFELLSSINSKLDKFENKENSKEGGQIQNMTKFEELLQQYNKTVEDITFEYDGLSDEELEAIFAENFGEAEPSNDPEPEDPENAEDPDGSKDPENEGEDPDGEDPKPELNSLKYSVTMGENTKEFALSLSDIQYALSSLVNEVYESDNTWYSVQVFEDSTVVMIDWWNGKNYRQEYDRDGDNFTLKGDRVQVYQQYLSQDEIDKLDELKANYSLVSEKLSKYEAAEAEAEKMAEFEKEEYSSIADKEEFAELKKEENHKDFTLDEVKAKLDDIIVTYAKKGALTFATDPDAKPKKGIKVTRLPFSDTKSSSKGRYGSLKFN